MRENLQRNCTEYKKFSWKKALCCSLLWWYRILNTVGVQSFWWPRGSQIWNIMKLMIILYVWGLKLINLSLGRIKGEHIEQSEGNEDLIKIAIYKSKVSPWKASVSTNQHVQMRHLLTVRRKKLARMLTASFTVIFEKL